MTPSITAWPPTIKSLSFVLNVLFLSNFISVKADENVCPTNTNAGWFGVQPLVSAFEAQQAKA